LEVRVSAKKPVEKRQGRGTLDVGQVAQVPVLTPEPDVSWRPATVERWHDFFSSPVASQVDVSDQGALRRLFRLYDEIERLWEAVETTGRVVEGSQGQPRPNPLFKQIEGFQAEARQLEDRFGLSPMARFRLGVQFADAHASLDALNERLQSRTSKFDDDAWGELDA
jgi:P27 family predicted phage terminase small subunit